MNIQTGQPTRRTLLKGAPAFGLAAFMAGAEPVDAAPADTEILRLFREHQRMTDALEAMFVAKTGYGNLDTLADALEVLEDKIMALPCIGIADFAAKAIIDTCRGELFSDWHKGALWIEARKLVGAV